MLEEYCEACSDALRFADVDVMTAIVFPRIAHIIAAGGVRCPCFLYSWGDMGLDFAS